jgi:hypothetical protein
LADLLPWARDQDLAAIATIRERAEQRESEVRA